MRVDLSVSNGHANFEIDIIDLVEACPDDERDELLQRLACSDHVIRHVMDQVLTGFTENYSHGSTGLSDDGEDMTPIEAARETITKVAADKAAQDTIERLRQVCRWRDARSSKDWQRIMELQRKLSAAEQALREHGLEGVA